MTVPSGSRWAMGWMLMGLVSIAVLVGLYSHEDRRQLKIHSTNDRPSVSHMLTTDPTLLMIHARPKLQNVKKNSTKSVRLHVIVNNISTLNDTVESGSTREISVATSHDLATPLFYMYDLEEEFWWRWPVDEANCSGNGYVGHKHKDNSGIGRLVRPDDGLFLTWHGGLFSSLYNRFKRSSRRTLDPEKASFFIIPYDIALDGYLNSHTCTVRRKCSEGLVGKLTAKLKASKYFLRHDGADHVLLWSLGQYHPWPQTGCDIFMADTCGSCTVTCYWMAASKPENRFVSIPFSSSYHWWDGIKNIPWDLSLAPQRNLTAVYLGSTQTLNPTHTKIRRAMAAQCNASTECQWLQLTHTSKDTNIAESLSIYKRAKFCLCPPGDDPARKAVFDTIISGCIPVIFEVNTIYNQYPWHLTEQEALDISVYIPGGVIRHWKQDVMSVLLSISPEVIRKKQEALAIIAPRLQYSMPPPELLKDRYDNTTWDPPFKDGIDYTLDGIFARVTDVLQNRSTNIPRKVLSGREWGADYNTVRIKVPNITADSIALRETLDKQILPERARVSGMFGRKRYRQGRIIGGQGIRGMNRGVDYGSNGATSMTLSPGSKVQIPILVGGVGGGIGRIGAGGRGGLGQKGDNHIGRKSHGGKKIRSMPSMGAPGENEHED